MKNLNKYISVFASFIIMLCIGSVYAWSIIAAELIEKFGFSTSQSQIIFGSLIAIFPTTMIFVGQLSKHLKYRHLGYISGVLFLAGYLLAGYSQGNFLLVLLGVGVLAGVATGFGYWVSLTSSVQGFPEKKGLITGIAAAGFGLGAVFMSTIAETLLAGGKNVFQLLAFVGLSYGVLIFLLSNLLHQTKNTQQNKVAPVKVSGFLKTQIYRLLFIGIFLGTFAGLLIIGSLKIIGNQGNISTHYLVLGVSFFAVANFLGRLTWGILSDYIGASLSLFIALLFQSGAILMLNFLNLTESSYLLLSFAIGFGFGGNFVLFAKETAQVFGAGNLGIVYPYVFLGYAIAGLVGPFAGGILLDLTGSYTSAIYLAGATSFLGSVLFLFQLRKERKTNPVH